MPNRATNPISQRLKRPETVAQESPGENDVAALRTLTEDRRLFAEYMEKFRGRIGNAPGYSILAEFDPGVAAVSRAVEIQRTIISKRVLGLPD